MPSDAMPAPKKPDVPLPRWLLKVLQAWPVSGGHNYVYAVANTCRRAGIQDEDALFGLIRWYHDKYRPGGARELKDREIWHAIKNSEGSCDRVTESWPRLDLSSAWKVVQEVRGRAEDTGLGAWDVLPRLFYPGELVWMARATEGRKNQATRPRDEWAGVAAEQQFLVPSPMTAVEGVNLDGDRWCRTLDNTSARRWLVVETDFPAGHQMLGWAFHELGMSPMDVSMSILLWLGRYLPLVMVVGSGGKSCHGWFRAWDRSSPEEPNGDSELLRFMRYAVSLGADYATWTRCQPVRVPGGTRPAEDDKPARRQPVFLWNPEFALPE